eukprot:10491823-Alexandrium_andersonii.AAC.1
MEPLKTHFVRQIRNLREKCRILHISGVSRTNVEDDPGSAQFKLRTPGTMLHARQGRLRIWVGYSTGGP